MKSRNLKYLIGVTVLVALGIAALAVRGRRPASMATAEGDAVAYVLKVEGKWQRQRTVDLLKSGDELRDGDTLSPESAAAINTLTVYVFGKGPQTILAAAAPFRVTRPSHSATGPTDALALFLPRVKEVFPEETISRGDNDQPLGGPVFLGDQGLDLASLRHGMPQNAKARAVRLRFLRIPVPSPAPAKDNAASREHGDNLEFNYTWDPQKLGVVPDTSHLEPGLYRLQVWSAPRKGKPLPAIDSDAFPDDEFLVVIVKDARRFEDAHRSYELVVQNVHKSWDENVPADIRTSFLKASLLQLAEQNGSTSGHK